MNNPNAGITTLINFKFSFSEVNSVPFLYSITNTIVTITHTIIDTKKCVLHYVRDAYLYSYSSPFSIYPAIRRAVRPPLQNSAKAKKLGGGSTARKSPIGED